MTQDSEKNEACWEKQDEKDDIPLTPEERKLNLMRIQGLIGGWANTRTNS